MGENMVFANFTFRESTWQPYEPWAKIWFSQNLPFAKARGKPSWESASRGHRFMGQQSGQNDHWSSSPPRLMDRNSFQSAITEILPGREGVFLAFCLFVLRGFVFVSNNLYTLGKKYKGMSVVHVHTYFFITSQTNKVGHRYYRQVTYLYCNSYISTPLCGLKLANLALYRILFSAKTVQYLYKGISHVVMGRLEGRIVTRQRQLISIAGSVTVFSFSIITEALCPLQPCYLFI